MNTFLQNKLTELQDQGLRRNLRLVEGSQGREIFLDGKKALNFCSNNYLGLADDVRLKNAALDCLQKDGLGSGASRLVSGNMAMHQQLEKEIAGFKGTESALLFSTGYMANVGVISSLFDRDDIIFSDRLNHASIVDGILLSRAQFKRYPHNDLQALEAMLQQTHGYRKRCIITDTVFSMDGDIAPLDQICDLAHKHQCFVMIDDAHGFGVLGQHGTGAAEHFQVSERIDIQMGTLSKAAGSFGAYVCGPQELIDFLINKARSFIYTTAMPPAVAAASLCAVRIIQSDQSLRKKLWEQSRYMLSQIQQMGFQTLNSQTPIIPILTRDPELTMQFSQELLKRGIYVAAIRPPTVPVNTARLRLTVIASHTPGDMEYVLEQLQTIGKQLCLIS